MKRIIILIAVIALLAPMAFAQEVTIKGENRFHFATGFADGDETFQSRSWLNFKIVADENVGGAVEWRSDDGSFVVDDAWIDVNFGGLLALEGITLKGKFGTQSCDDRNFYVVTLMQYERPKDISLGQKTDVPLIQFDIGVKAATVRFGVRPDFTEATQVLPMAFGVFGDLGDIKYELFWENEQTTADTLGYAIAGAKYGLTLGEGMNLDVGVMGSYDLDATTGGIYYGFGVAYKMSGMRFGVGMAGGTETGHALDSVGIDATIPVAGMDIVVETQLALHGSNILNEITAGIIKKWGKFEYRLAYVYTPETQDSTYRGDRNYLNWLDVAGKPSLYMLFRLTW
jgi:hypothetical protein